MELQEWIDLGVKNGVVTLSACEEMTFAEVYKKWFCMKLNVIKDQSCDRIECTWNKYYAGSAFVGRNVSALDEIDFSRFLTACIVEQGTVTQKEFRKIYQIANNVMVYAKDLRLGGAQLLDWEMIKSHIPDGKIVPGTRQEFAVSKPDIEKMMNLVLEHNIYPLKRSACLCLMLNFYLGLRVGELASLSWPDINREYNTIRVCKTETKSFERDREGNRCGAMVYRVVEDMKTVYSVREIPLLPEALYILEKLREHHTNRGYQSPYLAYDGEDVILVRSLDRTLRRLCLLCDVRYFSTHSIRKTVASMLHNSGMPTRYISDLLGHSEISTTERYYILSFRDNYRSLMGYMHQGLNYRLGSTQRAT